MARHLWVVERREPGGEWAACQTEHTREEARKLAASFRKTEKDVYPVSAFLRSEYRLVKYTPEPQP